MAWLNWSATVESEPPRRAAEIIGPFLDELQLELRDTGGTIAHVKVLAQTPGSYLKAALTGNDGEPAIEGDLMASPSRSHNVRVNVRAVLPETQLERIFRRSLEHLPGRRRAEHFQCFRPAAPVPERRI